MTRVIGIDAGKTGAMVEVELIGFSDAWPSRRPAGRVEFVEAWETAKLFVTPGSGKRQYIPGEMDRVIKTLAERTAIAMIETPSPPHPRAGGAVCPVCHRSGGKMGRQVLGIGFGLWWGILAANGVPVRQVSPPTWMGRLLRGEPGEGKERAVAFASRIFPSLTLPRAKARAEAIAEAACIALYGARYGLGVSYIEEIDGEKAMMRVLGGKAGK